MKLLDKGVTMLLKKIDKLNISLNPPMELLFALYATYKKEYNDPTLDWVETPKITYLENLCKLIDIKNQKELINYLKYAWSSCDMIPNVALVFDENYNLNEEKITKEVRNSFSYGSLEEFANLFKEIAIKTDFSNFLIKYKDYYLNLLEKDVKLPQNINLDQLINYFGEEKNSYNFLISVLVNGGFGPKDNQNNLFAVRGFQYDEEDKCFLDWRDYCTENMFHEFCHSYINPLIDKYYDSFENLDILQQEAIIFGLPKSYQSKPKTLLYEYFVRCFACVFAYPYLNSLEVSNYILTHGFVYLQELTDYVYDNMNNYQNFEEFMTLDLIHYFNLLTNKNNKKYNG